MSRQGLAEPTHTSTPAQSTDLMGFEVRVKCSMVERKNAEIASIFIG